MDFIEVIFGVSPDGGSGSLEFLILMVPLVIVAMVVLFRAGSATIPFRTGSFIR